MPTEVSEPYTLTQTEADAICALVAKGRYPATAASLLGIPHRTWARWSTEGKQALAEAEEGDELGSLAALALGIERAESLHIDAKLSRIDEAGAKTQHWAANGWDLERRYRGLYGKQEQAEAQPAVTLNFYDQLPPGAAEALHSLAQAEVDRATKFLPPGGSTEPQSPDSDQA